MIRDVEIGLAGAKSYYGYSGPDFIRLLHNFLFHFKLLLSILLWLVLYETREALSKFCEKVLFYKKG